MQGTQDTRLCPLIERLHWSPPGPPGVGGGDVTLCWRLRSDADEQLVADLDKLDDQIGERPAISSRYAAEPV